MSDRLWSAFETPSGRAHGPMMLHTGLQETALSEDQEARRQSMEAHVEEERFALLLSGARRSSAVEQ